MEGRNVGMMKKLKVFLVLLSIPLALAWFSIPVIYIILQPSQNSQFVIPTLPNTTITTNTTTTTTNSTTTTTTINNNNHYYYDLSCEKHQCKIIVYLSCFWVLLTLAVTIFFIYIYNYNKTRVKRKKHSSSSSDFWIIEHAQQKESEEMEEDEEYEEYEKKEIEIEPIEKEHGGSQCSLFAMPLPTPPPTPTPIPIPTQETEI